MKNDNTTPILAKEYDKKINSTLPYYEEFYEQTMDVVEQCGYKNLRWLDLGCGTGHLEELAKEKFKNASFVLIDPSENMLQQAKEKLGDDTIEYHCLDSASIAYNNQFEVITAIQAHHYMHEEERKQATQRIYDALKQDGIYISFENVIPEDADVKQDELLRWGRYQQKHGKTKEEAAAHNKRCGVNYFPITVEEHKKILKEAGFRKVHVFWISYMQMGIYGVK